MYNIGDFDIKKVEDGEDLIYSVTQKIYYKILQENEKAVKDLMTKYARENNAELMLIPEETVKIIIDLGCREYLKNYRSGYISKDKIRDKIRKLVIGKNDDWNDECFTEGRKKEAQIAILEKLLEEGE